MASRTVRGVVVTIASTAVAAAGLLATGGSASAATNPSGSRPGVVSAVRIADHHTTDHHSVNRHSGDQHRGDRHDLDSRHWFRYDKRDGHQARIGYTRQQWVLDQLRWTGDRSNAHWGSDSLKPHVGSHR
ncbi:hypothetical protein [Streptomyces cyslabdanicus]|uniref:hypothetical protein n=1 Tax=Streptomyces cyslabdanicus TaxID=1470456 RepID=UPI004043A117